MVLTDLLFHLYRNEIDLPYLFKEEIFALMILKLMNCRDRKIIYRLLVEPINIYCRGENIESINLLSKLNVLVCRNENIYLNEDFRRALIKSFARTEFNIFMQESGKGLCDETHTERFENILKSLSEYCIGLPKDLLWLFITADLVTDEKEITHKGFEFLLKMKGEQIGILVAEILNYLSDKYEYENLILLIAELLTKKQNTSYRYEEYRELFYYLNLVGLIQLRKSNRLIITPLMDYMIDEKLSEMDKSMIVETNYKIYANIHRSYEISILKLFSSVDIEFPEMIISNINRKSVTNAFDKGITADQINSFLKNKAKYISPIIFDQIKIWENMRNRIEMRDVVYFKDFRSIDEYHMIYSFVEKMNYLIFHDEMSKIIIADIKSYEEIKKILAEK